MQNYIKNAKLEKKKADALLLKNNLLIEELDILKTKYKILEDEIKVKNQRINELTGNS